MNPEEITPQEQECPSEPISLYCKDSQWLHDELVRRYYHVWGVKPTLDVPLLTDPVMLNIFAQETQLFFHDAHLFTSIQPRIYRHLIRCGMTIEQVATLFGLTHHAIQTANSRVTSSVRSQVRHVKDYNFGSATVTIDPDELKLHFDSLKAGEEAAKDCRIILPGRTERRRF